MQTKITKIKFVPKVGAWCKTEWLGGKQVVTWHNTKEEIEQNYEEEKI